MNEYIILSISQYKQICKNSNIDMTPPKSHSIEKPPSVKKPQSIEKPQSTEEKSPSELQADELPLYEFLKKKSPSIDWNANNELMISGLIIPDSNIFSLIKDATNNKGTQKSDDGHFRIFKKWLQDNNVPDHLVNKKIKEKEKLPEITPPINLNEIPTVESLKSNPKTTLNEIPTVENNTTVEKPYISEEQLRKSTRVSRPPVHYGRGAKIKWIKF